MLSAPGFSGRVIARSGREIAGYGWHSAPGSGACFPDGGGWIYVSNSEVPLVGGVGAIRFDAQGAAVVDAYATLSGTDANRAGGSTPWRTWLSGEQANRGQVWETDPWGDDLAVAHPAMGVFKHQACAVDGDRQVVYLTEDQPDGGFYRFTPAGWPELATGRLEVLAGGGWAPVPDPLGTHQPTRHQNSDTRPFSGGASCHYAAGTCWLTTTGDEVLAFDTAAGTVSRTDHAPLDVVTRGNEICLLTDDGVLPVVRLPGHGDLAGAALSPDGTRLYFSSPRGTTGSPADGMTYEVTGPFLG